MPISGTLHTDRPLSNLATAYINHTLIGLMLMPEVMVEKSSDKFFLRAKANGLRSVNPLVSSLQTPAQIDQGVTLASFACEDYALQAVVSQRDQQNADAPLNLMQDAALDVASQLRLAQEARIATLLQTSGSYDSNNVSTLTGTDRWDSAAGSYGDPLGVIDELRAKVWPGPNTKLVAWCGIEVWNKLKRHPQILGLISGGATTMAAAVVTKQKMAELLEVDEFVVGEAWQIATNPGQTDSSTRVWGKYFGLARVATSPSPRALHLASSFAYGPMNVQTWFDEEPGLLGAWHVKNSHSTDEKIVANDAGALVVSPIS